MVFDMSYNWKLLTTKQKALLGIKQYEFSPKALSHLSERMHQIGMYYSWSVHPNAVLAGLVICDLLRYMA